MDIQVLADEITNDPLARGYAAMTDVEVAADMNLVIRDGPADPQALLQYITLERFRTGTIYGRLLLVAGARPVRAGNSWEIAPLPLGVGDADVTVTQDEIAACASLLRFVDTDTERAVTLLDSRLDNILTDAVACDAIGPGDKTAIQALSQNQQTRGAEIGYGAVRPGNVAEARAI